MVSLSVENARRVDNVDAVEGISKNFKQIFAKCFFGDRCTFQLHFLRLGSHEGTGGELLVVGVVAQLAENTVGQRGLSVASRANQQQIQT